jgi:hypothetical protein
MYELLIHVLVIPVLIIYFHFFNSSYLIEAQLEDTDDGAVGFPTRLTSRKVESSLLDY